MMQCKSHIVLLSKYNGHKVHQISRLWDIQEKSIGTQFLIIINILSIDNEKS